MKKQIKKLWGDVTPASEGAGPILQRDYWAVLRACSYTCSEIAMMLRTRLNEFPPAELVAFRRAEEAEGPLEVGEKLDVEIRMEGTTAVRVVHVDDNSITLATVKGHPEAGRITFGAYRNEEGDVIFHIRSRARSSSRVHYAGFLVGGEPMQTNTWTDFIDRLAHSLADGVIGTIQAETQEIADDEVADEIDTPTFIAEGD